MHPSPALTLLRARTSAAHRDLERTLRIASPDAGRPEYAEHVAAMWGWLEPIEERLSAGPSRSLWLEEDIAAARRDGFLDHPIERRVPCETFSSFPERLGWAYVLEGSMLGGQVLLRRLGDALAPWPARWLHGYGGQQPHRWQGFQRILAEQVSAPGDMAAACDGACAAFASLEAWFRSRGVVR